MINRKEKEKYAENLRKNPTYCEAKLLMALKKEGIRHEFNSIVCGFIPDFYFKKAKLVVEIDGSIHGLASVIENDKKKDEVFFSRGIKVMRFTNKQVNEGLYDIVRSISSYIGHRKIEKKYKKKFSWKKSKKHNHHKKRFHSNKQYSGPKPLFNPYRFNPGENKTLYVPKEEQKVKRPLKVVRLVSRA